MSPEHDGAPGRHQGQSSSNSRQNKGTTPDRIKPTATHVIAEALEVVAGTGRQRTLLVYRCLFCGAQHVSHGRGDVPPVLERPAACRRGRVALHIARIEVAA